MSNQPTYTQPTPAQAVILAGGSGTRLWPLSRMHLPKQFLCLQGDQTLLEATIDRLNPVITPDNVLVVTSTKHAKGEAYHALQPYRTLLEPVGRNTAPAIALAAVRLQFDAGDEDPVMAVLPADHIITQPEAFRQALAQALAAARHGKLVTFGIKPLRPDTGFGYIQAGEPLPVAEAQSLRAVRGFTEKPERARAESFLADGSYYWNSGMFVWRASTILAEVEHHLPELHAVLEKIRRGWEAGEEFQYVIDRHFADMPDISIDYGVLERSANVALVPCEIGWSDVGSWDAVHEVAPKDEHGNSLQGNVIARGCRDSLIHSSKRLVAAVGVEDLCVVETADAVLVSKRGETQRVREIVDALKERNAQEHILHLTVLRPWGSYTVLENQDDFKMKRITVPPGSSLSLQRHQHRSEHWIVVSGTATVTRDGETITVTKNQSTYIPIGVKHRLENQGRIPLQMIEVQVGEYLEEDDIERFDDVYGRG